MKRNFRGLGLYVVIFLIIILGWYSFGSRGIGTNTCTQAEFEQALKDDKINSIVIKQNEEVPTAYGLLGGSRLTNEYPDAMKTLTEVE